MHSTTEMICADLERLGLAHHQSHLPGDLMFQQLNVPAATLLPLVPLLVKPIQLRLPITTASSIHIQNTNQFKNRESVCVVSYRSRMGSSSSSPVVTATSSSFTIGATCAPVSSSSAVTLSSSFSSRRCSGSVVAIDNTQ